jgi:WD40 repeat protein
MYKMVSKVRAVVTKKNLEFTPGSLPDTTDPLVKGGSNSTITNRENEFDVIVVNQSDKFASFQLELSTPVLDDSSQLQWYKVEPEICAKKPPGSETKFHVVIIQSPIPAYDTKIDLKLKAFSVEDISLSTSQKLSLNIKKPLRPLRVEVPVTKSKLIPESCVDIPVLVYNLSPEFCEMTLTAVMSDSKGSWLVGGKERKLLVESGKYEKTSFQVLAPYDLSVSKDYKLTIKVESNRSLYTACKNVILNLIASGNIEFDCQDKQKVIPNRRPIARNIIAYDLSLLNNSNLVRKINISVAENAYDKCELKLPEPIELAPGESRTDIKLLAKSKRPWWGRKRQMFFETSAHLIHSQEKESDSIADTNITDTPIVPNTQVLELQVLPIIPLWLQIFAGIIPFILLAYWLTRSPAKIMHTAPVNSVRFFGNGSLVFSGSSDRTIRKWQIEDGAWQLNSPYLEHNSAIADGKNITKAIRVIRPNPNDSKNEIAVGLENGEVKLWDIATNTEKPFIKIGDKQDKDNRIFDLVYTQNARLLYSGHGDGKIKEWNVETRKQTSIGTKAKVPFTISALALDNQKTGYPLLVIAGRYNQIAIWDMTTKTIYQLPYTHKQEQANFAPIMGQHQYITSLAIADNVLASADNQGYITLWNMDKVRACVPKPIFNKPIQNTTGKKNNLTQSKEKVKKPKLEVDGFGNTFKSLPPCNLYNTQWRDGHDTQPVRSVALTQDGKYLASAGDDGKAMLWELTQKEGELDKITAENQKPKQYQIDSSDIKLNSIDIKSLPDKLLITTGDDENRVRICRFNREKYNATCH